MKNSASFSFPIEAVSCKAESSLEVSSEISSSFQETLSGSSEEDFKEEVTKTVKVSLSKRGKVYVYVGKVSVPEGYGVSSWDLEAMKSIAASDLIDEQVQEQRFELNITTSPRAGENQAA